MGLLVGDLIYNQSTTHCLFLWNSDFDLFAGNQKEHCVLSKHLALSIWYYLDIPCACWSKSLYLGLLNKLVQQPFHGTHYTSELMMAGYFNRGILWSNVFKVNFSVTKINLKLANLIFRLFWSMDCQGTAVIALSNWHTFACSSFTKQSQFN